MADKPRVYVIGAGAGTDINMPVGEAFVVSIDTVEEKQAMIFCVQLMTKWKRLLNVLTR